MLGTPVGGAPGGGAGDPGSGLSALLGSMGGLGALGNMGVQPVSDPETAYASQLQQLQVKIDQFRFNVRYLPVSLRKLILVGDR